MTRVSLVIPCYNEEKRLSDDLGKHVLYFQKRVGDGEVILVNDGSTDGTVEKIRYLLRGIPNIQIINLTTNCGKGKAIREGVLAASGNVILYIDADFSTPIETVDDALKAMRKKVDMVVASRRHPKSELVVSQGSVRTFLGRGFTWLTNAWLGLSVTDVTCGFKCFRAGVAHDLFTTQRLPDWSFDAEILFIAAKRRYIIAEIPVRWTNKAGTRVHMIKDSIRSFVGLMTIRLNDLRGLYA